MGSFVVSGFGKKIRVRMVCNIIAICHPDFEILARVSFGVTFIGNAYSSMIAPSSSAIPSDSIISNFLRYPFDSAEVIQSDAILARIRVSSKVRSYHVSTRSSFQRYRGPRNCMAVPNSSDSVMFQFLNAEPEFGFDRYVLPHVF